MVKADMLQLSLLTGAADPTAHRFAPLPSPPDPPPFLAASSPESGTPPRPLLPSFTTQRREGPTAADARPSRTPLSPQRPEPRPQAPEASPSAGGGRRGGGAPQVAPSSWRRPRGPGQSPGGKMAAGGAAGLWQCKT